LWPFVPVHSTLFEAHGLPKGVAQISICRIADFNRQPSKRVELKDESDTLSSVPGNSEWRKGEKIENKPFRPHLPFTASPARVVCRLKVIV
jgi:hypothetical protein